MVVVPLQVFGLTVDTPPGDLRHKVFIDFPNDDGVGRFRSELVSTNLPLTDGASVAIDVFNDQRAHIENGGGFFFRNSWTDGGDGATLVQGYIYVMVRLS